MLLYIIVCSCKCYTLCSYVSWLYQPSFACSNRSASEKRTWCQNDKRSKKCSRKFILIALAFFCLQPRKPAFCTKELCAFKMAQSAAVPIARSPVGIPFFWESGMEPPVEWPTWAATLKLALMAKNSLNVDSLLKHKPDIKDLTYPAEPTYEPPTENATGTT